MSSTPPRYLNQSLVAPLSHPRWTFEISEQQGVCFGLAIKKKLHSAYSGLQLLEIFETETFGNLMVIDGCIMLTSRDHYFYHEMMTHPALYCHPAPRDIAIIGGGDCGTLQQALLHQEANQVFQVEIDQQVTQLAQRYFPELCQLNQEEKAQFCFEDGIQWIKQQSENSLDIIIVDSTDPVGPAVGLFERKFYQDCFRVLRSPGILVQQSESPFFHAQEVIYPMYQKLKAASFSSIATIPFPQPVYPSGWWSTTLAGKALDVTQFRKSAVLSKTFKTRYYNAAIHQAGFALPEEFKQHLPL